MFMRSTKLGRFMPNSVVFTTRIVKEIRCRPHWLNIARANQVNEALVLKQLTSDFDFDQCSLENVRIDLLPKYFVERFLRYASSRDFDSAFADRIPVALILMPDRAIEDHEKSDYDVRFYIKRSQIKWGSASGKTRLKQN